MDRKILYIQSFVKSFSSGGLTFRAVVRGADPHLKSMTPISRLASRLLHTSNIVFKRCGGPLVGFDPPCYACKLQRILLQ